MIKKFKIKCRRKTWQIIVFETEDAMYDHHEKCAKASNSDIVDRGSYDALTQCADGEDVKGNCIGEVLFWKGRLHAMFIAHEMVHAALHYLRIRGQNMNFIENEHHEESLAELIGELTQRTVNRFLKEKLLAY